MKKRMLELRIIAGSSLNNLTAQSKRFDDRGGTIGRSPNADWVLVDVSRFISSQHAKIIFSQGAYYLVDSSANGISTEQGQKLIKGEYQVLKIGAVYIFGSYHLEVTAINTEDETEIFKEAGLGHILEDFSAKKHDLCPLDYVQKQNDPLVIEDASFTHFPFQEKTHTLKAFDFMPEPFDFKDFGAPQSGTFTTQFCALFNLNPADFKHLSDTHFQASMETLFRAMHKKWEQR